jgi:prepilin-type N-terminal cleavage/methylation domain-containing protein
MNFKNEQSGRSMIEMLGVLAIMGVLMAGAMMLVTFGFAQQRRATVVEDIQKITIATRDMFRGFDDFSNLDGRRVFSANNLSARNPFGGEYELMVNPANPRQFVISITGLSSANCEFFVHRAWADSADFMASGGTRSGAMGEWTQNDNTNVVRIVFGE